MKSYILMVAFTATTFVACGNNQKSNETANVVEQVSTETQYQNAGIEEVITYYLSLKNALTSDNSEKAAKAGGKLKTALVNLGNQEMTKKQQKAYDDIAEAAEENAEHISENGGKIDHQREHFQSLSEGIYILVKVFGTSQTLYKDYCPMKESIWLSKTKDIKNPYYGQSMLSCGTVKETISKE